MTLTLALTLALALAQAGRSAGIFGLFATPLFCVGSRAAADGTPAAPPPSARKPSLRGERLRYALTLAQTPNLTPTLNPNLDSNPNPNPNTNPTPHPNQARACALHGRGRSASRALMAGRSRPPSSDGGAWSWSGREHEIVAHPCHCFVMPLICNVSKISHKT